MTLVNLAGTQIQVQEYLRAGQVESALNILVNRNIRPELIAQWLTPEQQQLLAAIQPELIASVVEEP